MLYTIPIMTIALLLASIFFHRKYGLHWSDDTRGTTLTNRSDKSDRWYTSSQPTTTILFEPRFTRSGIDATVRGRLCSRCR